MRTFPRAAVAPGAVVAAGVIAFAAAGCARAPRSGMVFEDPPRQLGPASSADPRVSVRASGSMAVLVTQRTDSGGGSDLYLYRSHGGDAYSAGKRLNSEPGDVVSHPEAQPQLVSGPGMRLCAVWLASKPDAGLGIELACSKGFGDGFDAPVHVNTGLASKPSFFSTGVLGDGTIVITWFAFADEGLPGTAQLWMTSTRDGQRFSEPIRVQTDVCPCCRPALASDGKTLFLAWRKVAKGDKRDIVLARSADGGHTWSTPQLVSDDGWRVDGCPHSGPALHAAEGRLWLAWMTGADDHQRLFWTSSTDGGVHFAPRAQLAAALVDPNHPSFSFLGTRAFVTFEAREPAEKNSWGPKRAFIEDLASGAVDRVPSASGASYVTATPLSPEALAVAWTDTTESNARAMISRMRLQSQ